MGIAARDSKFAKRSEFFQDFPDPEDGPPYYQWYLVYYPPPLVRICREQGGFKEAIPLELNKQISQKSTKIPHFLKDARILLV